MTKLVDLPRTEALSADVDLVATVTGVLASSSDPLTAVRIHAALPELWRSVSAERLAEVLQRQVAANVLYLYPRYRGPHERFWDRPWRQHLEELLRRALREGLLSWSDIRRRMPEYAKMQAESVLEELIARGQVFRHPPTSPRMGPRFGLVAPDARLYVQPQLDALFARLEGLGFTQSQLRAAALDLLHEAEWPVLSP